MRDFASFSWLQPDILDPYFYLREILFLARDNKRLMIESFHQVSTPHQNGSHCFVDAS